MPTRRRIIFIPTHASSQAFAASPWHLPEHWVYNKAELLCQSAPGSLLTSNDVGHDDKKQHLRTAGLPCPLLVYQRCGEQLGIPRRPYEAVPEVFDTLSQSTIPVLA